ncbi:MAG: peptide deformylase [Acidobacteria bacterium]|nr:peptide deformylase [Acidobacteriota bacterium]MCG3194616.1 Peptide deformylase [Thermoanaerobaculia bacterium]MCK6682453.1 peptide deformylase [Thermoanaerobaculia bacterium]
MAILKVVKLGAPVLRERASEIESHDLKKGRLKAFFEDLLETMDEYNGTGLAAPQVSTPLRVLLYMVQPERRSSGLTIPPTILVNPTFEVLDPAEIEDFEACLSVPFLAAKVPRPKKIRVRALDAVGKPLDFIAEDFHARVVLHESDHLDGTVYLDRVRDKASLRYTIDF